MPRDGVVIDCGGLDKFFEPDRPPLKKFWESFGSDAVHYITPIVYWEFLNQYDSYHKYHKALKKLVEEGKLRFLEFGPDAAALASKVYCVLKPLVDSIPKKKRRERLEPLQCDVFIAASAYQADKPVFTTDRNDWLMIQQAFRKAAGIRSLELIFADEI